jgi:hypothetical protein
VEEHWFTLEHIKLRNAESCKCVSLLLLILLTLMRAKPSFAVFVVG